ncbi:MAG: hypothetical protein JO142_01960 [Burkholderiales bacterium]|nr:hypothetical protein [Burkholderiales bacterium]
MALQEEHLPDATFRSWIVTRSTTVEALPRRGQQAYETVVRRNQARTMPNPIAEAFAEIDRAREQAMGGADVIWAN